MAKGPIRVLIVDDHELVAESLERLLADQSDIEVVGIAGTGAEALEMAAELRPDVVLMDFKLPDADGTDVARQVKERRPEAKVVMVTGYAEDAILIRAIEAGCSGFVTKQQASATVVSAVRAASVGESLIEPTLLARLLPRLRQTDRRTVDLTTRETEILKLVAEGLTNQAIAERLVISTNTVRNHVQNILTKLGVHSKLEAVATAVRRGMIRIGPG